MIKLLLKVMWMTLGHTRRIVIQLMSKCKQQMMLRIMQFSVEEDNDYENDNQN